MGNRPGNFAVQNSDLVIAIGNRLNIYQVGYQLESWAREAYIIDVDIDELELQKKTIRVDLPIYRNGKYLEQRKIVELFDEVLTTKYECLAEYNDMYLYKLQE
jgi:acetolactate synthase I/II/III large subunit